MMFKITVRAIIGVMIFFGYFLMYLVRYNFSVHIIEMAQIIKRDDLNSTVIVTPVQRNPTSPGIVEIISWDDMKVARLFAAYHIGYCVCFPIFHSFGERIGPTWIVGIAAMISGVLSCLTPSAAYHNYWTLFFVRMIKGFCAGAMQPSMVQLLRHWVPPIERNHFMWAYCGNTMGTCSTFLICAVVHYYSHWSLGFYISGGFQIMWSLLWVLVVTDSPRSHPCISKQEYDYLLSTIGTIFTIKLSNLQTPWVLILKSIPFWALCILNFGCAWMIIALCIHGPLYYTKIIGFNIYEASALTALPFFLRLVLGTIMIQAFHWYRHNMSPEKIKYIRKYFIIVSHIMPGIVVTISWMFPVLVPGPVLLTVAVALTAAGMDLTLDLCYELSPTFVNSIHTVIKIIGNTPGIIVSLCVGVVTQNYNNTAIVWKHIWNFHATVLFASGLVFLIYGQSTVQPWNFRRVGARRRKSTVVLKPSVMSNISERDENGGRTSTIL